MFLLFLGKLKNPKGDPFNGNSPVPRKTTATWIRMKLPDFVAILRSSSRSPLITHPVTFQDSAAPARTRDQAFDGHMSYAPPQKKNHTGATSSQKSRFQLFSTSQYVGTSPHPFRAPALCPPQNAPAALHGATRSTFVG